MASPFNTSTSSSLGTTTSAAVFGTTSPASPFSMTSATPFISGEASSPAAFGSSATISSPFGSTSANPFGSTSALVETPAALSGMQTSSPFGNTGLAQSPGKASAPAFDSKLTPSPFGSVMFRTSTTSTLFGAAVSPTPFGGSPGPFNSGSPSKTSSATFGTISTPSFGSMSTPPFGTMSVPSFGSISSPSFGSNPSCGTISTQIRGTMSTLSYGTMPSTSFGSTMTPRMSSIEAPSFGSATPTSAPAFGSSPSSSSIFGASSTQEGSGPSTTAFGTTTAPAFGSTTAFGSTSTVFGSTTAPTFGTTTAPVFGTTTTLSSVFGATTTTPVFGASTAPAFGATTSPAFGTPTSTPAFGTAASISAFGTTTSTPAFGTTTSTSAFGTTISTPAFGTTTSTSAFGTTTPAFGATTGSAFGTTTSASVFGSTTTAPAFGATTAAPTFGTTTAPLFGTTTASVFNTTTPAFGATTTPSFSNTLSSSTTGISSKSVLRGSLGFSPASAQLEPTASSASSIGSTSQESTSTSTVSQSPFGNTTSQGTFDTPTSQGPFGAATSQGAFGTATSQPTFGMPISQGPFGTVTSQGLFGTATSQRTFGAVTSQATFGIVSSQATFGTVTSPGQFSIAATQLASSATQPVSAVSEAKPGVSAFKQVPLFGALKSNTSSSSLGKEVGLEASQSKPSESRTSPVPRLFGGTTFQAPSSSASKDSKAESDSAHIEKRVPETQSSPLPLTKDRGTKKKDTLFGKEIPVKPTRSDPLEIVDELLTQTKKDLKSPVESSPEGSEKKEVNKIIAVQIPESCLDKEVLRRHFMKFGKVTRVSLSPKNFQATIQFESNKGAAKAKKHGKKLHPKLPEIKIFFGTVVRRKSQEGVKNTFASKKKEGAVKLLRETSHTSCEDLEPYRPLARPGAHEDDQPYYPLTRPQAASSPRSSTPLSAFFEVGSARSRLGKRPPSSQSPHPPPPTYGEEVEPPRGGKSTAAKTAITSQVKASPSKAARASPVRETKGLSEMKVTLQTKAVTSAEKYFVLDFRDKVLRQQQNKGSNIGRAKALAATCPDMCPEKERYMRDFKNDLSSFETMKGGGVDHNLAIKKYSRSSADQEEPLPHELRPGKVLEMTMDYLVCNVMDRMEEEGIDQEVWYNFIWDRTRSIRKDLTQQQLTDHTAVNLVEKCARFHIHCAARLCEEPPDVFDPKMNTENLTKCLQTLKHLYDDLQIKGQFCENEAKFRSYYMLLNLNEGDIMFEYQQYRLEVRTSPEVQFVVRVLRALRSNNYISFFRLLHEASYLQACILQRYFRQVRTQALEVICKSYSLTSKMQVLPTEKILSALGFEDIDDAAKYLEFHGIPVTDQGVTFDRSQVILFPEENPPIIRGKHHIESKRTCLAGEVVQGGPMPENPLDSHIPHDSFNDQGFLKAVSLAVSVSEPPAVSEVRAESTPHEDAGESEKVDAAAQEARQAYNQELVAVMQETQVSVVNEVVQEIANSVALEVVFAARKKEAFQQVIQDLIEELISEEVRSYCIQTLKDLEAEEEEIRQKQEEEEMQRRKEEEKVRNLAAFMLTSEYEQEVALDMVTQLCLEVVKEEEEEIKQKVVLELEDELFKETLEEVQSELSALVNEVIQQLEGERTRQLQEAKDKATSFVVEAFVLRWRDQMLKHKRRQVAMETFPACGSKLSVVEQDEAFSWGYARSKHQNLTAKQLENMEARSRRNLLMASLSCRLEEEIAWAPLPLNALFQKELQAHPPSDNILDQCFKLLLVMPDAKSNLAAVWLRSKLGSDAAEDVDCHLFIPQSVQGATHHILVQEAAEITPESLHGAAGVLYVPSAKELDKDVLSCCQDIEKMTTVVVITYAQDRELPDQRVWPVCDGDLLLPQTSAQLEALVLELWHQRAFGLQLQSSFLTDIFWKVMGCCIVEPVLLVEEERINEGLLPPDPSAYVDLYNSVLDHLMNATLDQKLQELCWPPKELEGVDRIPSGSWNSTDSELIKEALNFARLPELSVPEVTTLPQIEKLIQNQVAKVIGKEDGTTLLAHIRYIMDHAASNFWQYRLHQEEEFSEEMNVQAHVVVPWWNIMRAFIEYRAGLLPDYVMYFRPQLLSSFIAPDTWKRAISVRKPLGEIVVGEGASKRKAALPTPRMKKRAYIDPEVSELTKKTSDLRALIAKEQEKLLDLEKKIAEG